MDRYQDEGGRRRGLEVGAGIRMGGSRPSGRQVMAVGEMKQYEATWMAGATLKQEAIAGEAAPVAPSEAGKGRGWPR
jgi:hypothetical protein